MQNKKAKLPGVVVLMVLTLITLLFWISFTVYNAFTNEPTPVVPTEIVEPLNPQLDIDTINIIKNKN